MHELVLVLPDFYVSQEAPDRDLPDGVTLPGLQQVMRFGARTKLPNGWRPWLSRWLTGNNGSATATIAAAALAPPANSTASRWPAPPLSTAWMATPMHLIAGMTSVHVDRSSILRLNASDQAIIVADFQRVFHDSGFHLNPLGAGDFLMLGPDMPLAAADDASDPARFMGGTMEHAHSAGAVSPTLLRLNAELEMWLHDHPVNEARRRRGKLPVTALWLWGGGTLADVHPPRPPATTAQGATAAANVGTPARDLAFGRDSYLNGLWATQGQSPPRALPQQLTDVFSYPHAHRVVLEIEIGQMLQSNPTWSFFEAVAHIDRTFILPAVEALHGKHVERLTVLANDYELTLHPRDRLKFWRRTPPGLSGLQ